MRGILPAPAPPCLMPDCCAMLLRVTNPSELAAWRRTQRETLLRQRMAMARDLRDHYGRAISRRLLQCFAPAAGTVVGIYWPIKGEFDPRFVARQWRQAAVRTALPLVIGRDMPLEFRLWSPGVTMLPGAFGLPRPQGTPHVTPHMLLMPPVGWDALGYRLGYGAGYYDRTLAAMPRSTLKIGVGFECSRINSIDPQAHDIAMDFIVTEATVYLAGPQGLRPLDNADAVQRALRQWRELRAP